MQSTQKGTIDPNGFEYAKWWIDSMYVDIESRTVSIVGVPWRRFQFPPICLLVCQVQKKSTKNNNNNNHNVDLIYLNYLFSMAWTNFIDYALRTRIIQTKWL